MHRDGTGAARAKAECEMAELRKQVERMNVTEFFETYIYGHMCKDIERELDLNRSGQSAGSFLCTMGLLAYTEYMGMLDPAAGIAATSTGRFNAFFRRMGPGYESLLSEDVYVILRCGFIHEYFAKDWCTVYMLNYGDEMVVRVNLPKTGLIHPLDAAARVPRPVSVGVGKAPNGGWYFVVEKYLEDFKATCGALEAELETVWGRLDAHWIRPTTFST